MENHWYFKPNNQLNLSRFLELDYTSWKERDRIQILLEADEIMEKPNDNQIRTLQFIKDMQDQIIESMFEYYQKVIFPVFSEATDIEENEIIYDKSELSKVFGIQKIEIPIFNMVDTKYFLIKLDFAYDPEHGLYILFDNTNPIDFFGEGDKNYDAISFYRDGLIYNTGEPLKVNLYKLNGETVFQENYHYDELIKLKLLKGTYRTFITFNQTQICRNFYVSKNLEEFTLREILTHKYY